MTIRIKVNKAEFNQAASNGEVFGECLDTKPKFYVYIELGREREYIPKDRDNKGTEYRLFTGCDVYAAKTEEQLDDCDYYAESDGEVVIIYT
jgi:hypothetical protein